MNDLETRLRSTMRSHDREAPTADQVMLGVRAGMSATTRSEKRPERRWQWLVPSLAVAATVLAVAGITVVLDEEPPAENVPAPVTGPSGGNGSAASTSAPPTPVKEPTLNVGPWTPGDDYAMEALGGGTLAADESGCVHVVNGRHRSDLVWPAGYTADYLRGRVLVIRNAEGEIVLREGDEFWVGGGTITPRPKDISCQVTSLRQVFHVNSEPTVTGG